VSLRSEFRVVMSVTNSA